LLLFSKIKPGSEKSNNLQLLIELMKPVYRFVGPRGSSTLLYAIWLSAIAIVASQLMYYYMHYFQPRPAVTNFCLHTQGTAMQRPFHYQLPTLDGVLHVFLRILTKDGGTLLTGFIFLDYNNPKNIGGVASYDTMMYAIGIGLDNSVNVTWLRQPPIVAYMGYPWFSTTLPLQEGASLVFNVTSRFIPLDDALHSALPWKPSHGGSVKQILPVEFGLLEDNIAVAANLLQNYIQYHRLLGITDISLHCRQRICRKYKLNEALWRLISSSKLDLIEFNEISPMRGLPHYDQNIQYNHAILSHKGSGSYLYFPDIDELLTFERPTDINSHSCLYLEYGCSSLSRYMVYPAHNISLAEGNLIPSLTKWDKMIQVPEKSIVDPNHLLGFFVHKGRVCREYDELGCIAVSDCRMVEPECAKIAHFFNMFRERQSPENVTIIDYDAWLWPYKKWSRKM